MTSERICQSCKFAGDRACAVNPQFYAMWHIYQEELSDEQQAILEPFLPSACGEWEQPAQQTLSLTLSEREWRKVAEAITKDTISAKLVAQVREAIGYQPPKPSDCHADDTPF